MIMFAFISKYFAIIIGIMTFDISNSSVKAPIFLLPALITLVAPIFFEPSLRISMFKIFFDRISPNGILPKKYANSDTNKIKVNSKLFFTDLLNYE